MQRAYNSLRHVTLRLPIYSASLAITPMDSIQVDMESFLIFDRDDKKRYGMLETIIT